MGLRPDTVMYIWWCDRHGAIQTDGIDIFKDCSHFIVLLLALQRLTLNDWGFVPELGCQSASSTSKGPRSITVGKKVVSVDLDHPIVNRLRLRERLEYDVIVCMFASRDADAVRLERLADRGVPEAVVWRRRLLNEPIEIDE